jgi:hypothetical protein
MKVFGVLAGAAVIVGGCAAASHIKALQPPYVRAAQPISLPVIGTATKPGAFQRGIDIDWYAWSGEDVAGGAADAIAYAHRLHANAISVSFPFFMNGSAGMVRGSTETPTPAEMGILLSDARQAGMYVSLRPLLDEHSLGRSRVGWKPPRPLKWFRSYQQFLAPYAAVAQRYHVGEFIVGSELNFDLSPRWAVLDRALRHVYHGALACADNWGRVVVRGCGVAVQTVDAYHPARDDWLTEWSNFDSKLPNGTVETEIGIAASASAHLKPYLLSWPGPVVPKVQARWFSAACQAAVREHLGGIYFWSIGLGMPPSHGPTKSSETTWSGGPGARAIASCYERIAR